MSVPTFPAALTDDMQYILDTPDQAQSIVAQEDRPVAISLPRSAVDNAKAFCQVLEERDIEGKVFFAHKASSSPAVVSSLRTTTSIDVASLAELESALTAGYAPESIIATGPKTTHFLTKLAALPGVTIVIDSYSELQRLSVIASDDTPTAVLLRLTRTLLNQPGITKQSRFGLDEKSLDQALHHLQGSSSLILRGLAFHLDSQAMTERQHAVLAAVELLLEIQQKGFYDATILDIGGGYGTNYGLSNTDSDAFESIIRETTTGSRQPITWQARSYGNLSGVDLAQAVTGPQRLMDILDCKDSNGDSFADIVRQNLLELWIEPGSAICASAGLFAAEIIEVRECDGDYMVVVDAHRNQISFEGSEHGTDPILVPCSSDSQAEACEVYIAGHLCMESDFMTYRKIRFTQMPRSGDLLVWTHTGAYRSHFSTSRAIGHPLPARYTLTNKSLVKDTYDTYKY